MSNLYLAFSVVFPLFCMMALGYFLSAVKVFNGPFLKQLNSICFKVFLPIVLFMNIYQSDFKALFSPKLIIFAVVSLCIIYAVLMLVVPRLVKDNRDRGVVVQGIFRSNYILFGLPVTTSLAGAQGASVTSILFPFVVPLFNMLSIIALETWSDKKTNASSVVKEVVKNPLIIASVIAFLFVITGIKLPALVESTVSDISKVATPLALIALGGSFSFKSLGNSPKILTFSVLCRLIIVPLFGIAASVLLGFRGVQLVSLMCMFSSPTAVSSYTMAQSAGANDELAAQIVVVNSAFSILTVFTWITVLKSLALI